MRALFHGPVLLTLLTALGTGACSGASEVELLSVEGLEPGLVEPDGELRVRGSGLPVGRDAEVTLSGRIERPGGAARKVSTRVRGRALTEDEVVFRLDHGAFAELGEHGTFEGELVLAFSAHAGRDVISGRLPVTLDLVQPMARGPQHRQALRERARGVLDFIGVVPSESASSLSGLEIGWASPGSAAERAGLKHGDVIVRAGGVSVHSLGDLAPAPGSGRLRLEVQTPPQRGARAVELTLDGLDAPVVEVSDARLSVLVCWVVVCLLLLSFLPTPGMWLARCVSRLRAAPPSEIGAWGGLRDGGLRGGAGARGLLARAERLALRWLWPVAASLGAVLLVMLEPAGFLRLRSLSIYLAFAALSVGLTLLNDAGSARERIAAAADVGFRMLVLVVVILCACALSGTRTFDGLVAEQGALPWQWAVFRKPALLLSFPLFVVYAARLGGATLALGSEHAHGRTARLLVAERVFTNVVLCAVGVAVYAGGWQCPAQLHGEHVPARLVGALLFVLKCWGFAFVLQLSRRISLGAAQRWSTTALQCLGIVALTGLGLHLEPGHTLELALGRGLFGALAIATWVGLTRALTMPNPMGVPPSPVAPFKPFEPFKPFN